MGEKAAKPLFRMGDYQLDSASLELSRNGRSVRIERLAMRLLLFLIERREGLVSREEIAGYLWGQGVHVDIDNGINTAIGKLRSIFRDDPARPRFIKTVTGLGYRFIAPVEVIERVAPEGPDRPSRVMVAVLPFEDLSPIPGQEYFADVITEEAITHLGQVEPKTLGVISRTSTMAYRRAGKTVAQIGAELHVDFVLESSFRRGPARARITSRLIRVSDQTPVWSGSFDRDTDQLQWREDELGQAIAQAVGERLMPPAAEAWQPQTKGEAYDLYLRGTHLRNQWNPQAIARALECFGEAVALDPSYAPAWARIAECYAFLPVNADAPCLDVMPKATEAARRAVELAPRMSEGHGALGAVRLWMEWDWAGAESSLRRALELNASNVNARLYYAILLNDLGRFEESAREMALARELDPLSPLAHGLSGALANHARRDDLATEHLQRALMLNPNLWVLHVWWGRVLEQQGQFEKALEELRTAFDGSWGNGEALALQACVQARAGNPAAARERLAELCNMRQAKYVPPTNLALIHAALGEKDRALDWLDEAYSSKDVRLTWLAVEPRWDSIRGEPRFQDFLARLRLPRRTSVSPG